MADAPPTCPYCGSQAEFRDSRIIYGQGTNFGMVWICRQYPNCDAYVGVHKNTKRPLGRLANPELRRWKKAAHAAFDPMWRHKVLNGQDRREARNAGYRWLAGQVGMALDDCHVGMFDVKTCKRVVEICEPYRKALEARRKRA